MDSGVKQRPACLSSFLQACRLDVVAITEYGCNRVFVLLMGRHCECVLLDIMKVAGAEPIIFWMPRGRKGFSASPRQRPFRLDMIAISLQFAEVTDIAWRSDPLGLRVVHAPVSIEGSLIK